MPVSRASYFRNPNIGLFAYTDNELTIVPRDMHPKNDAHFAVLGTALVRTTIFGSALMGVYIAGNKHGVVMPEMLYKDEKAALAKLALGGSRSISHSKSKFNAFGNNLALNDKGCIVSKNYTRDQAKAFEELFQVEVLRFAISGYWAVGALCRANNKGALVSNKASDEEIRQIESVLKVPVTVGSVNFGEAFIKLGAVANDKGLVAGQACSGFEIGNMQSALGIE